MFAPLRLHSFRHLLAAYGVSQLGDWAGEVALAVAVFAMTGSALAVAATWLVHRCLAALAAPVLVAHLEDRPRGRLLATLCVVQAAIFVALAVMVAADVALVAMLALLAVDGVLAPVARALSRSSVVTVTQQADLHHEGNALINLVFTVNGIAAPALGGLLVAVVQPAAALLMDAATFLLAAGALVSAHLPHSDRTPVASGNALTRLRAGVRYVRSQPVLAEMLATDAALAALMAMILPIEVVFVTGTLGAGDSALGAVLTAWGAGMVVGGLLLAQLRRMPLPLMLASAVAATAVGTLGMGAAQTVTAAMVGSLIGGVGNGIYGMAFVTAFQERTADAFQARVNGLYDTLMSVAPGIGFVTGGLVATIAGPRAVYFISGAGCLAVLTATAARLHRLDWSPAAAASAL